MAGPAVVQVSSRKEVSSGTTDSVTLPGSPTSGNWLVGMTCENDNAPPTWTPANGWTLLTELKGTDGSSPANIGVWYRQIMPGDTTTVLVPYTIAVSTRTEWVAVEVSGIGPTFLSAVVGFNSDHGASASSVLVSTPVTTTANDQLAMVFVDQYTIFGNSPTFTAGWTSTVSQTSFFNQYGIATQALPTSGTSQAITSTWSGASSTAIGVYLVLQTPSAAVNYNLSLTQAIYAYSPQNIGGGLVYTLPLSVTAYAYTPQSLVLGRPYHLAVDTVHYAFTAGEIGLTPRSYFHSAFATLTAPDFKDWGVTNFDSHFTSCQALNDPSLKTKTPYIYSFLKEQGTDAAAMLRVEWDWVSDTASPRVTEDTEVYVYRNGYLTGVKKTRVPGRGRSLNVRYSSELGKDFNILGWVIFYDTNAGQ